MSVNHQCSYDSGRRGNARRGLGSLGIVLGVTAFAALLLSFTVVAEVPGAIPPQGAHDGKDVAQPIEFPHNIHADVNKINCMYCHTYARRSKVAGIPPTSKCMGCHSVIATDKPRIKKLTEYWENREPPPWNKVHDVPDYVHFTHEKHLKRFVFDNDALPTENVSEVCAFCHGEVKTMTVAHKTKPLNMGFCKRCHEANHGPFDCWQCHK
ncbi:MAG: hypothetical protein FD165_1030 [Gammaproteobacteria bacterium]|nr:MAG: hypothetical protein FD165_1030 [Gammaproteobacteria bacterium]TND06262.1 MAG: hypothetical protein FD120_749 [Gammaproteobacteria bacterium]